MYGIFSPSGKNLALGDKKGKMCIVNIDSGEYEKNIHAH